MIFIKIQNFKISKPQKILKFTFFRKCFWQCPALGRKFRPQNLQFLISK